MCMHMHIYMYIYVIKWDAQLQALEPRLVRLGYSFYHPEERQYTLAATDGAKRDAFADWAVI